MLIWCLELYSSCAMLNHFNRKNFCCYAVFYNNTFLIQGHFLSHHPSCFGEFKLIFPILFYRRLWKWRHLKSGFPCMHFSHQRSLPCVRMNQGHKFQPGWGTAWLARLLLCLLDIWHQTLVTRQSPASTSTALTFYLAFPSTYLTKFRKGTCWKPSGDDSEHPS